MKYPIGTKLKFKKGKKSVYPVVLRYTSFGYELEWHNEQGRGSPFTNIWSDFDVDTDLMPDNPLEQYVLNKLKENGYG